MASASEMDINYLHMLVLRELENDSLQEVDSGLYRTISEFIGNLKKQEFDGVEGKIKESLITMATELTTHLINTRVAKISKLAKSEAKNLLDEEKFIMDAHEKQHERTELVLSATLHGKSKFLESVSQKHKTKPVVVRFLQDVDELVGVDLAKYGPFKTEDIASIPYENAQALLAKNAISKIHWED